MDLAKFKVHIELEKHFCIELQVNHVNNCLGPIQYIFLHLKKNLQIHPRA